jgi:hypothetical protein
MMLLKRLSHVEKIQPMRIDATKIAATQGDAVAIEELKDLDRYLSPILHLITELCGRELPVGCMLTNFQKNADHLGDGVTQKEMIVRHLIELPEATEQLA